MSPVRHTTHINPSNFDWAAPGGPGAVVRHVVGSAADADGAAPLDEAALLGLRHGLGGSSLWLAGEAGFAWRHGGADGDAVDVVVAPDARGQGLGGELAAAALVEPGPLTAWSHGHHPAAAALAAAYRFERTRDLWVMRRPLGDLPDLPSGGAGEAAGSTDAAPVVVRTFEPGRDEDAVLALNAAAFAHHPEQGGLTLADLREREAQDWFDPAGFFLAERDGRLVGFHWTKVHTEQHPPVGEVYVVGVSPTAQGGGLGRLLTLTGLHHLAGLGLEQVILYVEADNAPAVAVYTRLGFTHAPQDTHVQYSRA